MNSFQCSKSSSGLARYWCVFAAASVVFRGCGNIAVRRTSTDPCSIFHLCVYGHVARFNGFRCVLDLWVCFVLCSGQSDMSNGMVLLPSLNSVSFGNFHKFCWSLIFDSIPEMVGHDRGITELRGLPEPAGRLRSVGCGIIALQKNVECLNAKGNIDASNKSPVRGDKNVAVGHAFALRIMF